MAGQVRKAEFRWDSTEFRRGLLSEIKRIPPATDQQLGEVANDIATRAKQLCPVRHGQLRNSIGSRRVGEGHYEVFCTARYGPYVEFGTGLFGPRRARIFPHRARMLRFNIGGKWVYARSVAGARPQPFMRPAWAEAVHYYVKRMRQNRL